MTTSRDLEQLYRDWSPKSAALIEEAKRVMPGGDTRASAHYLPYPLAMERGEGARIYDIEGRSFLDFMNNFTSLIHGHAYGPVVKAIQDQAARGTAFAAPTQSQVDLAALMAARVPSLETMRFAS